MEISAVNTMPDVNKIPYAEAITSNVSPGNKQATQQNPEVLDNAPEAAISQEKIAQAIEEVNKALAVHNTRLEFSIHEKTKGIMVKVVDEKTGEVIREVPPKRVLDMVAMTWEEIGLLVDEKA